MSYDLMLKNALSLHESGHLDEAEKIYRQILVTAPDHPDILNLLGLVAQAKNNHSEACSLFMNAIKNKSDNVAYYYNLAFSLKSSGRTQEALDCFLKVAGMKPEIKETYNEIALLYQKKGELSEARKNWIYAISLDKTFTDAKINLALSYREENTGKAIDDLKKLAYEDANNGAVFYYLASLYFDRKNWEEAWKNAIKAKELAPTSDEVRVLLGKLSYLDQQIDNAKIYFAKAELLNPYNTEAIEGLADIYSREGNYTEAELRYKKLIEFDRNNYKYHSNYAEMLQRSGRISEALEEYRAAVIINPQSAEISNNLALILRDIGEFDEALGLLFNALSYAPQMDEVSINIYETLVMLSETDSVKANKIAENWFNNYKDNVFAKRIYAASKGEKIENHQIYIQKLFDNFADNYELVMQNLDYSVPMAMGRIAGALEGRIVDLGCGTGLVGEIIKNDRNKLIGVDISNKMLEVASAKKVYDKLIKDDIVSFLQNTSECFDWAIAADVFGYIGDLSPIIKSLRNKKIIFSVEVSDEVASPFILSLNGRYKYNTDYIIKLLYENSFVNIKTEELILRSDNGNPVKGKIFLCKK